MGSVVSQLLHFGERIVMWMTCTALVCCLIITLVAMLGLGVGLGYNYSFVDYKTRQKYRFSPGQYKKRPPPRTFPHHYMTRSAEEAKNLSEPFNMPQNAEELNNIIEAINMTQNTEDVKDLGEAINMPQNAEYVNDLREAIDMPQNYEEVKNLREAIKMSQNAEDVNNLKERINMSQRVMEDADDNSLSYQMLDNSNYLRDVTADTTDTLSYKITVEAITIKPIETTKVTVAVSAGTKKAEATNTEHNINTVLAGDTTVPQQTVSSKTGNGKVRPLVLSISGLDLIALLSQLRAENRNYSVQILT